jgi:hypothetical protein
MASAAFPLPSSLRRTAVRLTPQDFGSLDLAFLSNLENDFFRAVNGPKALRIISHSYQICLLKEENILL